MSGKFTCFFICLILTLGMSGCGSRTPGESGGAGTKPPESGVETEAPESPVQSADLGITEFTVDESKKAAGEFTPGEDFTLALTDGNGLTWSLTIPGDALLSGESIAMTALSDVQNSELGELAGGVLLEPDGLGFLNPATLAVSGNGAGKNGIILVGRHDGSSTQISNVSFDEGGASSRLFHFSSAYFGEDEPGKPDPKKQRLQKIALQQIRFLELRMEELYASPVDVPEPPSIPLVCGEKDSENADQELYAFIQAFLNPERDLLQEFINAESAYLTAFDEPYESDTLKYDISLRWGRKLEKLLTLYAFKPSPEKFTAVYKAYKTAAKYRQALLSDAAGDPKDVYDRDFIGWAGRIADKYAGEVREKHEYRTLSGALAAIRYLKALDADNIGSYKEEIKKVLTFKVTFKNSVRVESMQFTTEGEATVAFRDSGALDDFIFNGADGIFMGEGAGNYTSFQSPEPKLSLVMPNGFPFSPVVSAYRPCKSDEIHIHVDRFGAETESFRAAGMTAPANGVVNSSSALLFNKYMNVGEFAKFGLNPAYYKFPMTLQSGEETAAEKSFSGSSNGVSVTYELRLRHTPQ